MGQKRVTRIWMMLAVVAMMSVPRFVLADAIYLRNGGLYHVSAWRDVGDEIEFSSGGGIIRLRKSEVHHVEGNGTTGDLLMYSAKQTSPACDLSTIREYTEFVTCLNMQYLEARRARFTR